MKDPRLAPTPKDPAIVKLLERTSGVSRNSQVCAICKQDVKFEDFRDELSIREYRISRLCQNCQDDFFGV